jgi:L-rhamnose mutarotase
MTLQNSRCGKGGLDGLCGSHAGRWIINIRGGYCDKICGERKFKIMKRTCFLLRVKKDRIEEYKKRHAVVWPEMLQALRETGWRNYSLFLREDGLLVGYVEIAGDFDHARAAMAKREVNARWQKEMAEFFEAMEQSRPDETMQTLEEVFHLD